MFKDIIKMLKMTLAFTLGLYMGSVLQPIIFVTFRPTIIKGSYIRSINTPNLGNEKVKEILDKFNKMGYDRIVNKEGWRPIDIVENKDLPGSMIGAASVGLDACRIELESKSFHNALMAEQVVIHEYLHCLGYEHTSDPQDLMFASYNRSSEDNVLKYAKDVYNRLLIW